MCDLSGLHKGATVRTFRHSRSTVGRAAIEEVRHGRPHFSVMPTNKNSTLEAMPELSTYSLGPTVLTIEAQWQTKKLEILYHAC